MPDRTPPSREVPGGGQASIGNDILANGDLVISADFGTSGVKVGVVDSDLNILTRVTETYPLALGSNGFAEQNPEDWWAGFTRAVATLHKEMPDLKKRVGAIVFCSQVCSVICADENGTPLRPCLTWMDKRGAAVGNRLIGGFPSVQGYRVDKGLIWLALANGAPAKNGMDPTAKFLWVRENEPELWARTRWLLDARDWLVFRATGEITASPESANLTWVMDTRRGHEGWSKHLCRLAGVPIERMPPIVQGETRIGGLTSKAATELGLDQDVEILGGTIDVTAAALGAGEVEDGALHISVATSAWIAGFFPGRRLSVPHSFATITSGLDYRPLLIASQENSGSAMQWVVENTGGNMQDALETMGALMADDPVFLPWMTGERVPVDDRRLRGTFHGLGLHHDADALRRAAVEGVVQNLRWAFGLVSRQRGTDRQGPVSLVGGAAATPAFAQMLADALDRQVRVGEARHAGMLGAATLAAPIMGWADSATQAAARLRQRANAVYTPDPVRVDLMALRAERLNRIRPDIVRSYRRNGGHGDE